MNRRTSMISALALFVGLIGSSGCGAGVNSEEQARRAYLGLDGAIDKAITLGFAGFNTASSANISPQMTTGTVGGTLKVTGQVDQGASANKGMRLITEWTGYTDDGKLTYTSVAGQPQTLDMQLKGIPTGTLTGAMASSLTMAGELTGVVTLALAFTGNLEAGSGTQVNRKAGTTRITGTATSPAGVYQVDITR